MTDIKFEIEGVLYKQTYLKCKDAFRLEAKIAQHLGRGLRSAGAMYDSDNQNFIAALTSGIGDVIENIDADIVWEIALEFGKVTEVEKEGQPLKLSTATTFEMHFHTAKDLMRLHKFVAASIREQYENFIEGLPTSVKNVIRGLSLSSPQK